MEADNELTAVGRACIHATISHIRRHGADTDFWGGLGALRVGSPGPSAYRSHLADSPYDRLIVALIMNTNSKG